MLLWVYKKPSQYLKINNEIYKTFTIMKGLNSIVIIMFLLILTTCKNHSNKVQKNVNDIHTSIEVPMLEIETRVKSEDIIEFKIVTNVTLPTKVGVSVYLKEQNTINVDIGAYQQITLKESNSVFDFDIKSLQLPTGKYLTKVSKVKWVTYGDNKLDGEFITIFGDTALIEIKSSYGSVEEKKAFIERQTWVFENVAIGTTWDVNKFKNKLGNFKELKVSEHNPKVVKAFYFPNANMTIFVSKPLKSVLMWRIGETTVMHKDG